MILRKLLFLALGLACAPPLAADPSVQDIIDTIDARYQIQTDITAQTKITTRDPDLGGTKVIEAVYYRRDSDDAFLVVLYAPDTDKGNGYLRVGDNMWLYLSKSRAFQHIGRGEKIGGSNATAGDMETRKFKELYKPALDANGKEIISQEMIGKIPVYKIELTAKVVDVKYPKLVMWLTRDKLLRLKEEYYSLSGTLLQTAYYKNYKNVDGRYLALVSRFDDAIEKDNVSVMEITGISFDKVDDYKFEKRYLESLSK
ncbi:MAG: outer membrane lipoprotein-sorting protein [Spirochaetales bacterium]|nr:outer membrane lipoprotein-sorting protein [Spirochaetales bacterium]